ncbi:glutamate--tRNA ligase [Kordiimonas aquimaris]|uniref:glutamate--tRNA ligase n=1 Tax=Kordiimonas aquimaris TaxID=707591 RepID=UPI0021CE876D|nr:glutamate--tRNA ligase [Kordiimonas aquimaris]
MPKVITRFAPSPTGFLHIGGARTALYNWLYARRHNGQFLLRIEDTDRKRSTDEAVAAILAGMSWLGLDCDGEAVSQYAQAERHKEVALKLLADGKAYRCYATSEELAELRSKARDEGKPFLGDVWRDKEPDAETAKRPYAIRIKMPREGEVTINDEVQGNVTVQNKELDDMILLRSDGTPTYMLAVVVDDHDMGVTHVIRGDDHLNNAFRQYQVYAAMGWSVPVFAHIPLIHGPDGKKLSKRHGALGVEEYAEMGFVPEAMRNYLLRLGWSHGDDEIISTQQAIEWFNLENVGRGPARFDFDKLDNLNAHYMRTMNSETILSLVKNELEIYTGDKLAEIEIQRLLAAMPSIAERAKRLPDVVEAASLYCNTRPLKLTEKASATLSGNGPMLVELAEKLLSVSSWKSDQIKEAIISYATAKELKLGKVMQPIRAALTGGLPSGDLTDLLEILGQQESYDRLLDQANT